MWDRQYFISLVLFAVASVATFTGFVSLLLWLGWPGLVLLLAIVAGFLTWFYWGPRADLKPEGRGDRMDEAGDE